MKSGQNWVNPHQFCKVLVWSGRLEGFKSRTANMSKPSINVTKVLPWQGRPRAVGEAEDVNAISSIKISSPVMPYVNNK